MFVEKTKLQKQENIIIDRCLSPYDKLILDLVQQYGGFFNAHTHLDRADTLDDIYLRHINTTPLEASSYPLSVKQNLTGDLHRGRAYTEGDLRHRMENVIERLINYGTTGVATCIDVSPEIGEDGLLVWRVARELKEKFKDSIAIKIAPNPIFGFKEGTRHWEIFVEASKNADFLTTLPEKDDPKIDGKIGFRENIRKVIELGCNLKKEVHIHLDQANDPREEGTLKLIEGLRWMDKPPAVWAIHCISPSTYPEPKFNKLLAGLLEHNIGVIVCPSAALSMRQLRPLNVPTHNSIARVLDLVKNKVPVMIGTDNIADVFVPQSNGDMLTELLILGHAIRFATPYVLAKLAAGIPLNDVDRAAIERTMREDRLSYRTIDPNWK